jgi:hypothetical protein
VTCYDDGFIRAAEEYVRSPGPVENVRVAVQPHFHEWTILGLDDGIRFKRYLSVVFAVGQQLAAPFEGSLDLDDKRLDVSLLWGVLPADAFGVVVADQSFGVLKHLVVVKAEYPGVSV